jgi:hypothetical protein
MILGPANRLATEAKPDTAGSLRGHEFALVVPVFRLTTKARASARNGSFAPTKCSVWRLTAFGGEEPRAGIDHVGQLGVKEVSQALGDAWGFGEGGGGDVAARHFGKSPNLQVDELCAIGQGDGGGRQAQFAHPVAEHDGRRVRMPSYPQVLVAASNVGKEDTMGRHSSHVASMPPD